MPLHDFDLGPVIGSGGMGTVRAAISRTDGRRVAVKVVTAAGAHEAMRNEVRAMAALDHPGVVRILDHGRVPFDHEGELSPGAPWFAMPRAAGSLADRPPAGWDAARAALLAVLSSLAHAHAHGVLHRDVKPANVLVGSDGACILADFGIARVAGGSAAAWASPLWSAPEQLDGADEGPWTDVYAAGALATWLVTGRPPFSGDPDAVARAHREVRPPPLVPRFHVPPGVHGWVARALEKDPGDRFAHAADAAFALTTLGAPAGAPARAAREPPAATDPGATLPRPPRGRAVPRATPRPSPPPFTPEWADPPVEDAAVIGLVGLRPPPLVGQEAIRRRLWDALGEAIAGRVVRRIALHGPEGCGKSRLASWLATRAAERGFAEVVRLGDGGADLACALAGGGRARVVIADEGTTGRELDDLIRGSAAVVVRTTRAPPIGAGFEPVSVPALAPDELAMLVRAMVPVGQDTAREVAELCAGSPGLAVRIVEGWALRDALVRAGRGWVPTEPVALPAAALAGGSPGLALAGDARRALEIAAALGSDVRSDVWTRACTGSRVSVPETLPGRLAEAGHAQLCTGGWRFVHPGFREAVLAATPDAADVHRACAEALAGVAGAAERRARHWLAAGRPEAAFAPLAEAVQSRADAGAYFAAHALAAELEEGAAAAGVPETDPARIVAAIHIARGIGATDLARGLVVARSAEDRGARSGRADLAGRSAAVVAYLLRRAGDMPGARAAYERALDAAVSAGPLEGYAHVLFRLGDHDGALVAARRLQALGPVRARLRGQVMEALVHKEAARHRRAVTILRRALGEADALGMDGLRLEILDGLGDALRHLGRVDEAEEVVRAALSLARTILAPDEVQRVNLGLVLLARGRVEEALVVLRGARSDADRRGLRVVSLVALGGTIAGLAAGGEWDEARAQADALAIALAEGPVTDRDVLACLDAAGRDADRAGEEEAGAAIRRARSLLPGRDRTGRAPTRKRRPRA